LRSRAGGQLSEGLCRGQPFRLSDITLTATYNDQTTADATALARLVYYGNDGSPITGNAFAATAGPTKVTFVYGGQSCELAINPVKAVVTWQVGTNAPKTELYAYGAFPSTRAALQTPLNTPRAAIPSPAGATGRQTRRQRS
jgi:hypothetical protein